MGTRTYMFTDGSCSGRGYDMGAWCAVVVTPNTRKILHGTMYPTTVNRCELIPMIMGLQWIRKNLTTTIPVRIYTDSEHTAQAASGLFTPDENTDLWAALACVTSGIRVEYRWRERNSHPYMELCDAAASTLRRGAIEIVDRLFNDWKNPETTFPCDIELPQDKDYDVIDRTQYPYD